MPLPLSWQGHNKLGHDAGQGGIRAENGSASPNEAL